MKHYSILSAGDVRRLKYSHFIIEGAKPLQSSSENTIFVSEGPVKNARIFVHRKFFYYPISSLSSASRN